MISITAGAIVIPTDCIKGGNALGYQWLVFWPVKVNLQLIRADRFPKPPVFKAFWPRESGEHSKNEKKVDSAHKHALYSIGDFFSKRSNKCRGRENEHTITSQARLPSNR